MNLLDPIDCPIDAAPQAALNGLQQQVFAEARRPDRPLRHVQGWLLDRRNLLAAWDRVQSADGADTPGDDGVTCASLRPRLDDWLGRLADDLHQRRYRPQPVRWIDVPKPNKPGQFRRLGILTVRDRVVHAALKQVLEPILEPVFLPTSFGFRPGRSVAAALGQALRLLEAEPGRDGSCRLLLPLDVADCFDTIDHGHLTAELARHVADPLVTDLLELILAAGGDRTGLLWWQRRRGLVQGSSLSPILCNLALHPLDLAAQELSRSTDHGVHLLRYADDLLLLARDARLADRCLNLVKHTLARLHQKLRSPVGAPRPVDASVEWLGVCLRLRRQPWAARQSCGYHIPDAKVADMLQRLTEMTTLPSDRIDASAFNLSRWIVSLNDQLRDWRQAYLFADNAPEVFRALDEHTRERVGELLHKVTGLRRAAVVRQYLVKLPRGFRTWEYQGARLSVLSSLAPQAPGDLVRPPTWARKPFRAKPRPAPVRKAQAAPPRAIPLEPLPALPAPQPPTATPPQEAR